MINKFETTRAKEEVRRTIISQLCEYIEQEKTPKGDHLVPLNCWGLPGELMSFEEKLADLTTNYPHLQINAIGFESDPEIYKNFSHSRFNLNEMLCRCKDPTCHRIYKEHIEDRFHLKIVPGELVDHQQSDFVWADFCANPTTKIVDPFCKSLVDNPKEGRMVYVTHQSKCRSMHEVLRKIRDENTDPQKTDIDHIIKMYDSLLPKEKTLIYVHEYNSQGEGNKKPIQMVTIGWHFRADSQITKHDVRLPIENKSSFRILSMETPTQNLLTKIDMLVDRGIDDKNIGWILGGFKEEQISKWASRRDRRERRASIVSTTQNTPDVHIDGTNPSPYENLNYLNCLQFARYKALVNNRCRVKRTIKPREVLVS